MSERWVKATTREGDERWINMAQAVHLAYCESGCWITMATSSDVLFFKEPPDHFLPRVPHKCRSTNEHRRNARKRTKKGVAHVC